ncbi:hypothetical protein HMPREF0262_02662 [Clostridium sp. ATCC 29733]|nr:hypothetical protein HMPREF0262_02662 [Clostridium sp. ATCC 29733]
MGDCLRPLVELPKTEGASVFLLTLACYYATMMKQQGGDADTMKTNRGNHR